MQRTLIEDLLKNLTSFNAKIVSSFVHIRVFGGNRQEVYYQIVQIVGTKKDFTKGKCKRLQQSVIYGLVHRPTVSEFQENEHLIVFHQVKIKLSYITCKLNEESVVQVNIGGEHPSLSKIDRRHEIILLFQHVRIKQQLRYAKCC